MPFGKRFRLILFSNVVSFLEEKRARKTISFDFWIHSENFWGFCFCRNIWMLGSRRQVTVTCIFHRCVLALINIWLLALKPKRELKEQHLLDYVNFLIFSFIYLFKISTWIYKSCFFSLIQLTNLIRKFMVFAFEIFYWGGIDAPWFFHSVVLQNELSVIQCWVLFCKRAIKLQAFFLV